MSEAELAQRVSDYRESNQKYHLFLGAGASVKSGVRLASRMMQEFEARLSDRMAEIRLEKWYADGEFVFARLFERAHDTTSHRQNYIRQCLEGAEPSEGYYFLASLINSNAAFRVVMTTNFDDLVSTASMNLNCSRRPLELWNKHLFGKLDAYSDYPIVVKLHGDYRSRRAMKNSVDEVNQTFKDFVGPLTRLASNSGLVVAGYSGADRVLIEMLHDGLRREDDDEEFFPLNIYWCLFQDEKPVPSVAELARRFPSRFKFVRTEGFDSVMESIYHACTGVDAELTIPPALSRKFVKWLGDRTVEELGKPDSVAAIRYGLSYLGVSAPADLSQVARTAQRMADLGRAEDAPRFLEVVRRCRGHFIGDPMITFDIALAFLWLGLTDGARELLELGRGCAAENGHALWNEDRYFINSCLVRLAASEQISQEDLSRLRKIAAADKVAERMGAAVLLNDGPGAAALIDRLIEQGTLKADRTTLRKWYILKFFYDRHRGHISPGHLPAFDDAYGPAPAATA